MAAEVKGGTCDRALVYAGNHADSQGSLGANKTKQRADRFGERWRLTTLAGSDSDLSLTSCFSRMIYSS
jgi:hypothetical protein